MGVAGWYILVGVLLAAMAFGFGAFRRLPLTTSMVYLAVGYALGPGGFGVTALSFDGNARFLEHVAEVAVLISLATAGLKLRAPLRDARWVPPLALAGPAMIVTVAGVALAGWGLLGLPLGAAVLLGAILAPTDPVLASDVQLEHPHDQDRLRFALTGEAGLNDGTAFPFVMLGLGLLGAHELGRFGWYWLSVDVLWAVVGGLGIGWGVGWGASRALIALRRKHEAGVGLHDFLFLGSVALTYGLALAAHTYGFLAVFAAGLALRQVERVESDRAIARGDVEAEHVDADQDDDANVDAAPAAPEVNLRDVVQSTAQGTALPVDPALAPAFTAGVALAVGQQLERVAELFVVVLLGIALSGVDVSWRALLFAAILLAVVRPVAARSTLLMCSVERRQKRLIGWFGIRGVGSAYYLAFAAAHGLAPEVTRALAPPVLVAVAASVVLHGLSVTPLMARYERRGGKET